MEVTRTYLEMRDPAQLQAARCDDPRIRIDQSWLDRYELEYYLQWKAITLGYRVVEVGVSKTYPQGGGNYSKIRRVRDWWSIVKPTLVLWLGVRD